MFHDSNLILLLLLTPLLAAAAAASLRKYPRLRDAATLAIAAAMLGLALRLLQQVKGGNSSSWQAIEFIAGVPVFFAVEPLGLLFAVLVAILWLLNSLYSISYLNHNRETHQSRFYCFFALAIFCTLGIALAGNLLTLFIFYEGLSFVTYPLVTHKRNTDAYRAGRLYLAYLLGTSLCFLLPAVLICHFLTGGANFQAGGILPLSLASSPYALPLFLLCLFGVGKAAVFPGHRWLPAAMVAPTPVSALLHAVAVVKAGVFTLLKLGLYLFGPDFLATLQGMELALYLAGFTIVYASAVALTSDNLKRMLAYSTISQLSYVVLATVIATPLSLLGAALHMAAHAFGKITLFFAAGAIYTTSGKQNISQLSGIGRHMPWTLTAFAVGSFSMIGMPFTAGFLSKWYILQGAYLDQSWFAMVVIVISTVLNAAYFLPVLYTAFFREADTEKRFPESPWLMRIALVGTACITVLLFFFPGPLLDLGTLLQVSMRA